jgi:hypothetical protein
MYVSFIYMTIILTSAYVSIRLHTSAYVTDCLFCSLRRFSLIAATCTGASATGCPVSIARRRSCSNLHTSAYVSIRQHTSAYVSIRQNTRPHTSAYVSTTCLARHRPTDSMAPAILCGMHSTAPPTAFVYVCIRQHTFAYVCIRKQSFVVFTPPHHL